MGTDIHMAAEVRKNGKWSLVKDEVFTSSYSSGKTYIPYDGRNYDLFAILADVRNGFGFAGYATGTKFNSIDEPRGYPEDMSDELKLDLDPESWDNEDSGAAGMLSGQHSASYVTLEELLEYDWSQKHQSCGYVTEAGYKRILDGKMPNTWCGGVTGSKIEIVDEDTMKAIIAGTYTKNPNKEYYVFAWFASRTYAECASIFYSDTIEVLKTLIPDGGAAKDVRLVFDFDS